LTEKLDRFAKRDKPFHAVKLEKYQAAKLCEWLT